MQGVAHLGNAGENPNPSTQLRGQALRRVPGILQHFPRSLEKEPLMRIHIERLLRRNVKKEWIKIGEAVEEAAPFSVALALGHGLSRVFLVKPLQTPAFRRYFTDAVPPLAQKF